MPSPSPLDGLLEICDRLCERRNLASRGRPPSDEDRARAVADCDWLAREVFPELPGLRVHPRAAELDAAELLTLALLFHRRLGGLDACSGADLLALLRHAGVDASTGMALLAADGRLRRGGWMRVELAAPGFDPVDACLEASHQTMRLFWPDAADRFGTGAGAAAEEDADGERGARDDRPDGEAAANESEARPYREEAEFLWDLCAWRNACVRRADSLFEVDTRTGQPSARHQAAREAAHGRWLHVRRRLRSTPGSRDFGLEAFARRHRLGPDHVLLVVHILFSDLLDGESLIAPAEALRLVCEHRNDLFVKRRLLGARGRLRRLGILAGEGEDYANMDDCPLTLSGWAAEQILGRVGRDRSRWSQQEFNEFFGEES